MNIGRTSVFLDCGCGTQEHLLRFDLDVWRDDMPELYASIYLNPWMPWWRRCVAAVRYVLGMAPCKGGGHWDSWIIDNSDDAVRLTELLEAYEKARSEWAEKFAVKYCGDPSNG